jgi:phage repressor protein C with HTH and peptisase S24 domain
MNKVKSPWAPNAGVRIQKIRGALDKTAFAVELGVSPSYITMLEQGKRQPGPALTVLICQKFGINKNWLFTGEGEMLEEKEVPLVGPGMTPYKGALVEVGVFALAGAGQARDLVGLEPIKTIVLPKEFLKPGIVPVMVQGESMAPTFYDGAVVGVDKKDRQVISGKVYAVWLDYEGAVIKRVFVEPGKIVLKSDNPGFPESHLDIENIKDGFILGRVTWVIQKL